METKMTCLYNATMDDIVWAFVQVTNYWPWLKGTDQTSLKIKVVAHIGDPKLHVEAMRSYIRVEDLKNCALEEFELFKPTKR